MFEGAKCLLDMNLTGYHEAINPIIKTAVKSQNDVGKK